MKKRIKQITTILLAISLVLSTLVTGKTVLADNYTQNSYEHDSMFVSEGQPKSNTIDGCYFAYEYGADGIYNPMAKFAWVNGWINAWSWSEAEANYPAVANWFIGANPGKDGVIRFHSERSGEITISAPNVNASGSVAQQLMIIQERGDVYYPIYPTAGRFEWKGVTAQGFDLSVNTTLKTGDDILVIARCNNEIISINPVITFTGNAGTNILDAAFTKWNGVTYKHSDTYNTEAAQSGPVDGCYFTYEYGVDGIYNLMAKFAWVNGWINAWSWSETEANYPAVANWFIGANAGKDGVIRFHSAKSGEVIVHASNVNASGTEAQQLMIVQKRGENYYPIYPTVGKFEWKDVTSQGFDLSVQTTLKAEDDIFVIARCNDQIISIDPAITFTGNTGTDIPDAAFTKWNTVSYAHSDMYNTSSAQSEAVNGSYFSYQYGVDGVYQSMKAYQDYGWVSAWSCSDSEAVYPAVANWFIAVTAEQEGVISWYSAKEGKAVISSNNKIFSSAEGAEFIIVQKRGDNYYPLYPTAGSFEWKALPLEADAFVLPDITTDMKSGDEILFIARGNQDGIIQIDPKISFTEEAITDNRQFTTWPITEKIFEHSGTFNQNGDKGTVVVDEDGFTFSYNWIENGKLKPLNQYYTDQWITSWTKDGEAPMVSSWFVSGGEYPGAIRWKTVKSGKVTIASQQKIYNDSAELAAKLLIAVERDGQYYPIYPQAGAWEWKDVSTEKWDLPEIVATVQENDSIVFAVVSDGNVVAIDPTITIAFDENAGIEDALFTEWKQPEKPEKSEECSHSGAFNDSDKEKPQGVCQNGSYFTYEFGENGKYEPMTRYSINPWYQAWTAYGEEPEVTPWFISSNEYLEGAIKWHSNGDGEVVIKSQQKIMTDSKEQTADFMIVQRRNGKIYPLYPTAGKIEWKKVTDSAFELPEIKTIVKNGDTIEFIVRSKDRSVVKIDPTILFLANDNAMHLKDSDFFEFPILEKEAEEPSKEAPQTGDSAPDVSLLLGVMFISMVLIIISALSNVKRKERY